MLDISKISSKGQVTIPFDIRKALKLNSGSKVVFVSDENGRFYIMNASLIALENIQKESIGVAEANGINNEEDVVKLIKEMR